MSCPDENTLLAFVDGRLTSEGIARLERHIAGCQPCADLLAAATAIQSCSMSADNLDGTLTPGQAIGRFVVLHGLGRGGMGDVYAAYDPQLDRKVAVKLLRSRISGSSEAGARLMREAQTIAKLSHPNVVVVYEVGAFRDSIFIAMEFLLGSTLGAWLEMEPRTWRETLPVFLSAGRGLAAAHSAGIIHRDFKLDNVMITRDGQVRVMDFGLARQVVADEHASLPMGKDTLAVQSAGLASRFDRNATTPSNNFESASRSGGFLSVKLTQTGAQMGTPAYMAPEQFLGTEGVGAHTDQFSFCVGLYRALYGEAPFEGNTLLPLQSNVLQGRVRPPPEKSHVPLWIRRVLLRGLATDPRTRFPSMVALLGALEADPQRSRRKRSMIAASAAMALVIAFAANRLGAGSQSMCVAGNTHLTGVWESGDVSTTRKEAIRKAFAITSNAHSTQAFSSTSRLLDSYVARWVSMYKDACEATHLRGEQSEEVLDLRMACLRDRLGSVRALTDVFANADEGVVLNAASAAGALPGLDTCANVPFLRATVRPPEDPATRKRVDELKSQLATFIALRDSGQCVQANAKAIDLTRSARATGYRPFLADVLNAAGILGNNCGFPGLAIDRMKEAYVVASATHYDRAAAEAAIVVSGFAAARLGELSLAHDWLRIAQGALQRLGPDLLLESWLLNSESLVYGAEGRHGLAIDTMKRAVAAKEIALGPDHPDTLASVHNLGLLMTEAGRFHDALDLDHSTDARIAAILGSGHPMRGVLANNDGESLNRLGRFSEARASFERAITIWKEAGSDPTFLSYGLTGLGQALLGEGRPLEAVDPLENAYAIRADRQLPKDLVAETAFALARALSARPEERSRAVVLARRARSGLGEDADPDTIAEIDTWLARWTGRTKLQAENVDQRPARNHIWSSTEGGPP